MKIISTNSSPIFIVILLLLALPNLWAYKLTTILGVSNTEKTIFVRIGFLEGVDEGMEATFTSDNLSIIARAIKVTREFSVWKIVEPNGKIPFEKNQIVTFNYATERIWMFDPDNYLSYLTQQKRDLLRDMEAKRQLRTRANFPHWLSGRAHLGEGLNQTVGVDTSKNISSRQQKALELIYGYTIPISLQFHIGIRYEEHITNATNINVKAQRSMITGGINYYYQPLLTSLTFYHYVGASIGYGNVKTQVGPENMSGDSILLPGVQTGLEYITPFGPGVGTEIGIESIYNKESFSGGYRQDSSETNIYFRLILGYLF